MVATDDELARRIEAAKLSDVDTTTNTSACYLYRFGSANPSS